MTAPTTRSVGRWSAGSRRSTLLVLLLCSSMFLLAGCGWVSSIFGGKKTVAVTSVSVFKVDIGQCFNPPTGAPKAELSDLSSVACTTPHTQEAYAAPTFVAPAGGDSSVYPGDDALVTFAKGTCAQSFTSYVGVSYLDSSLFFTYLLPSARSWEQSKDRTILCFVTTTGEPLMSTVKGSKL